MSAKLREVKVRIEISSRLRFRERESSGLTDPVTRSSVGKTAVTTIKVRTQRDDSQCKLTAARSELMSLRAHISPGLLHFVPLFGQKDSFINSPRGTIMVMILAAVVV